MFDELRDGGEAGAFETVLTLSEREGEGEGGPCLVRFLNCWCWWSTYIGKLDDEVPPLLVRKHRQDVLARFAVTFPHQEVSLLPQ